LEKDSPGFGRAMGSSDRFTSQFPHLENGNNKGTEFSELEKELNVIMGMEDVAQW
jgi:hypothetical protein